MRDFALEDAIWNSKLPPDWKLLLQAMAAYGERIYARPETIAKRISRSERYVQDLQGKIAAAGVIVRVSGGGRGNCAEWRIDRGALERVHTAALIRKRERVHRIGETVHVSAERVQEFARKGAGKADFLHAEVELYKQLKPMRAPAHTREGSLCPGLDPWEAIKATLQKAMDPHTFSTWFRPSRFSHTRGDAAFVVLPTPMFVQVVQKFDNELQRALADSCVDLARVQFVSAEQGRAA